MSKEGHGMSFILTRPVFWRQTAWLITVMLLALGFGAVYALSPVAGSVVFVLAFILLALLCFWQVVPEFPLLLMILMFPLDRTIISRFEPIHLAGVFAMAVVGVSFLMGKAVAIRVLPSDRTMLALTAWVAVSSLWSPNLFGGILLTLIMCFGLSLYFLPRLFVNDYNSVCRVLFCWVMVNCLISILALLFSSDSKAGRYTLLSQPNMVGAYLSMTVMIALGLFMGTKPHGKRLRMALYMAPSVLVLVVCQSRGAWIGCAAGMVFLFVTWREFRTLIRRHLALVTVLAVLAVVMVSLIGGSSLTERFTSLASPGEVYEVRLRRRLWEHALERFVDTRGLGIGAGGIAEEIAQMTATTLGSDSYVSALDHPHSYMIYILAELGVVGLAIVLWLIWSLICSLRHEIINTRDPTLRALLYGISGACISLGVHSLVDFDLRFRLHWLLLGLATTVMAITSRLRENNYEGCRKEKPT